MSTFAGNSALLPSDNIDFVMLPAQRLLAGDSFIVRCHLTSKVTNNNNTTFIALLGEKFQLYNNMYNVFECYIECHRKNYYCLGNCTRMTLIDNVSSYPVVVFCS